MIQPFVRYKYERRKESLVRRPGCYSDPTGAGLKLDPNYLNDPFTRIVSTDWVSVEDVKKKAEELGFLFEFRRLTVPFKLQQFDFSIGDAKALIRHSGLALYQRSAYGETDGMYTGVFGRCASPVLGDAHRPNSAMRKNYIA